MLRHSLALAVCLISGCQSTQSTPHSFNEQVSQQIHHAKTVATQQQTLTPVLKHVRVLDKFYVPQISATRAFKPDWWFISINDLAIRNLSVADLMFQLSEEYPIDYAFDKDTLGDNTITLNYSGNLGGLVQKVAALSGLHYLLEKQEQQHTLIWQNYQTHTFDVSFIPGKSDHIFGELTNATTTDSATTGSQSLPPLINSSAHQSRSESQFRVSQDMWGELNATLNALKSEKGFYSISEATSTIFVKDHPEKVSLIGQYLNKLNDKLSRLIAVDVQIIEVRMNDSFNYGVNWNIVRQALDGTTKTTFSLGGDSHFFSNLAPTVIGYDIVKPNSEFAGSGVLINALEQQGNVSVLNSPRVVTLNNQLAEIAITERTTYLAATATRSTANVGAETALQPGVIEAGLKLHILPLLIDNAEVLMQVHVDLSDLTSINTVVSGDSSIQTPNVLDKRLLQKARVPLGKTLMLAGLTNLTEQASNQGLMGKPWLNGHEQHQQQLSEVIILITPHVLNAAG